MAELQIAEFEVPYPDSKEVKLQMNLGACRIHMKPGTGDYFVEGTYEHPVGTLTPRVVMKGGQVKISQEFKMGNLTGLFKSAPKFELFLGTAKAYELRLETGAIDGYFEFGGLPLTRMVIKEGAGNTVYDFSQPNPETMSLLDIDAGAVNLEMKHLANANFTEMRLNGGAASYKLHFGGTLRQNANVQINTGLASVELLIPSGTAAKIESRTTLAGIDMGEGFLKKDGVYRTQAAIEGQSPLLTIRVDTSLGSVSLKTV
jgi:hypothetical protein